MSRNSTKPAPSAKRAPVVAPRPEKSSPNKSAPTVADLIGLADVPVTADALKHAAQSFRAGLRSAPDAATAARWAEAYGDLVGQHREDSVRAEADKAGQRVMEIEDKIVGLRAEADQHDAHKAERARVAEIMHRDRDDAILRLLAYAPEYKWTQARIAKWFGLSGGKITHVKRAAEYRDAAEAGRKMLRESGREDEALALSVDHKASRWAAEKIPAGQRADALQALRSGTLPAPLAERNSGPARAPKRTPEERALAAAEALRKFAEDTTVDSGNADAVSGVLAEAERAVAILRSLLSGHKQAERASA